MKCPNVNHPEYKQMSKVMGDAKAHRIYNANNGNFLSSNFDGTPSELFNRLQSKYGTDDAIRLMALNFNSGFPVKAPTISDLRKEANPAILRAQVSARTQSFVSFVTEKIEASFPGFSVNFMVNEDVAGTVHENKKGWIQDGVINYNLDRISYDTLVHEPFHLYLWSLRETNPLQLEELRNEAKVFLDGQHPIAMGVKQANPDLAYDELMDEIIATIAGISSKHQLLNVVGPTGMVRNMDELNSAWDDVSGLIDSTIGVTHDFFQKALGFDIESNLESLDFQNSKIFEIGQAFARDVLDGKMTLSNEELNVAFRTSFIETVNQRDMQLHPPILKAKDFIGYLNNGTNQMKSLDGMNDDALARYYMVNRDRKNNAVYVGGEKISLLANTEDGLMAEIKQKVIPQIRSFDEHNRSSLKAFLNDLSLGEDLYDATQKHFKKKNDSLHYAPRVLQRLANIINVDSASAIMYYSDLKDSENELIRDLYDPSFEGYDPMVVIHQIKNDAGGTTLDVSIIDVTSMPLGTNGLNLKGRNLFSSIMNDQKAYATGVNMNNSDGDFRKLTIGMTMMSMKQKMMAKTSQKGSKHDIKFRGLGVIGIHKKNIDARLVSDTGELIGHVKHLTQTPLMQKVENSGLRTVLENESLYEADYDQSFVAMMQQHLAQRASDRNYVDKAHLKTMLDADPDAMIEMLQSRQRYLEKKFTPEQLRMNDEYTLISGAIMELKYNIRIERNSLKDMAYPAKWGTSTHNVRSMVLQHIIRTANTTSERVYDATNNALKPFRTGLKSYKDAYLAANGGQAKQLVADMGSKYYEHLFKHKQIPLDSGDGITMVNAIIPELHWDINDVETQEAIARGEITTEDVQWAKMVADAIEETYIDNIYHKNRHERKDGKEFSRDHAKQILMESGFKKGMIPTIHKSVNEKMFDGDIKGAMLQFGDQMSRIENVFADALGSDNEFMTEVSDRFGALMNNEENLKRAGLFYSEGKMFVSDQGVNASVSTNLEKILAYFMLSSKRKQLYEKDVLPLVNNANMLMMWLGDKGISQHNNQNYLREYIERLVHMKTQDTDEKLDILGYPIQVKQAMNVGLKTIGFLAMGYRPWLGVKSHVFNELQGWMTSFANTIARNDYFTAADYLKAHNLVFSDYKKAQVLADRMHLTNGEEGDLVNNPFRTITNRDLGQSQYSNLANHMSDIYARRVVMVAQMLHEGSWDAYEYNEETGEVDYDETKDRRMYDSDGKITEEGKAIKTFIKKKLVQDGLQDKESDKLSRGHDYESGQLFKYLSDKYVIGSMDNRSKSMLGNHYMGRALGQFRLFSVDKLFNWGVDAASRESIFGGTIKAVKDKDGNWVAAREIIEIEGQLQSLGAAIRAVRSFKDKNLAEWWSEAGPVRKTNLARLGMKVAFSMMLIALIKNLFEDDERTQSKFAWIYSDLMDASLAYETITNPVPIVSQMQRLIEITFGDRKASDLKKFIPGFNAVDDVFDGYKMYEKLTE